MPMESQEVSPTDYGPYKIHPLADAFPLLEGEEFEQLVEDIREHGLGHPITLTADKLTIVDGRNRYRACDAANVDPNFEYLPSSSTDEQIAGYIISENLHRRHLSAGQRAMLALEIEKHYAELAKQRQVEAGQRHGRGQPEKVVADLRQGSERDRKSSEQAAKAVGASGRAVQQAKAVIRDAPDLAAKVKTGEVALNNAYQQTRQTLRIVSKSKAEAPPAPTRPKPDIQTVQREMIRELERQVEELTMREGIKRGYGHVPEGSSPDEIAAVVGHIAWFVKAVDPEAFVRGGCQSEDEFAMTTNEFGAVLEAAGMLREWLEKAFEALRALRYKPNDSVPATH